MKWYRKLYMGDTARTQKYKMFGYIRKNRFSMNTYLIALSNHPDNLLDIFSANVLKQPHFKKKQTGDMYIVGLAKGRDEALEVVRQIIDDVYTNTGGFDIRKYLRFGQLRKK